MRQPEWLRARGHGVNAELPQPAPERDAAWHDAGTREVVAQWSAAHPARGAKAQHRQPAELPAERSVAHAVPRHGRSLHPAVAEAGLVAAVLQVAQLAAVELWGWLQPALQ